MSREAFSCAARANAVIRWLTVCRYNVLMAKRKATFYIDEDVLRAARVRAARHDRRDSDVVEQALRGYLGFDAIERVWSRSDLTGDEAMQLAIAETHAARGERRATRRS